jgi:hypothetical protein
MMSGLVGVGGTTYPRCPSGYLEVFLAFWPDLSIPDLDSTESVDKLRQDELHILSRSLLSLSILLKTTLNLLVGIHTLVLMDSAYNSDILALRSVWVILTDPHNVGAGMNGADGESPFLRQMEILPHLARHGDASLGLSQGCDMPLAWLKGTVWLIDGSVLNDVPWQQHI